MEARAEMPIRSVSNHDDEGDEDVKNLHMSRFKQAGLHALHVHFFNLVHFAAVFS